MKTSVVVPFVTLLVGAGLVYFARSNQIIEEEKETPTVSSPGSNGPRASEASFALSSGIFFSEFTERILATKWNERKQVVAEILPKDRRAHLEFLLKKFGPEGLDHNSKSAVGDLLEELLEEDMEGALQWVLAGEHTGNRDYLFGEVFDNEEAAEWGKENFNSLLPQAQSIGQPHKVLQMLIGIQIERDLLKAIQLSKENLVDYQGEIDFPNRLQEKAIVHEWEMAFNYYKGSWKEDNSSSGYSWSGDFSKDFDFSSSAAKWKNDERGLDLESLNGGFYEPPSYIWKVWSEQDLEAAFEFLSKGGSSSFDFDDFFGGYAKRVSSEDFFGLNGSILSESPDVEMPLDREFFGYLANDLGNLKPVLDWSEGNNAAPVTQALIKGIQSSGDSARETGFAILKTIPEGQLLNEVRDAYTSEGCFRLWNHDRKWFGETLKSLGHAESEINAAIGEKSA
ncbi:hypothetical protein N9118_00820 [Akkermansiaceae bacterium]|jgi:hypothetical protein|nr:hypothetical protein [Akkermansiaceae bacterium]